MSTLRVDNFQAADGLSPAFPSYGVAKAAANYDQVTPATNESENVSSISDDATGVFTINFTNNLGSTAYAVSGMVCGTDTNRTIVISGTTGNVVNNKATSAIEMNAGVGSTGSSNDFPENSVLVTGDLA